MALAALFILLVAGLAAGRLAAPGPIVLPRATLAILALAALGLAAQLVWPGLLPALQRDGDAVVRGQVWRLGTAIFVQDGGLAGGLFNLMALLAVGALAERFWRPGRWLSLHFGGALATEVAALWLDPVGAGNSFGWCALLGALALVGARAGGPARWAGAAALGAGLGLVGLGDPHGAAALIGAGLCAALPPNRSQALLPAGR